MAQHIVVREYDPLWSTMFEAEAAEIKNILGENCVEIYHIGSTSVVGLAAKPIIDIMPVVRDLAGVDKLASAFENIGYAKSENETDPGRPYLFIAGFQEETFQALPITLLSGRLPENDGEILVSGSAMKECGISGKTGTVIQA